MLRILQKTKIEYIIIITLVIRLFISFLPPFEIDQNGWRAWSYRMAEVGPGHFYSKDIFTNNPPGFLYVFWLMGEVKKTFFAKSPTNLEFDLLLKLPTNLADIASAFVIYLLLKRKLSEKLAKLGFIFYVFNPALFFNSSIWGQFDGSAVIFMLLSLYLLLVKKIPELSTVSFAIAFAIKPQALAFAPIFGMLMLIHNHSKRLFSSALVFIMGTLVIYLPFFPSNPLIGFLQVNQSMAGIFTCTTCYAFNFWGSFGNWQNDQLKYFGITYLNWGLVLLSLSFIPIFFLKPFQKRYKEPFVYLTATISIFSFFIFLTRMHERYLYPIFAFLLLAAFFLKSKKLLIIYAFTSVIYFINQYLAYGYYNYILPNKTNIFNPPLINYLSENFKLFSFVNFIYFILLVGYFIYLLSGKKMKIPKFNIKLPKFSTKQILIAILVFTALTRLYNLSYPKGYVFDEVYHAFTAKEYLAGHKEAWEYWTTPPPGVAFEWTHPPLAKEIMTASMYIFNTTDAWAYRLPGAIIGIISIYLIYLLVLSLFKNQTVALFSAFIFSIDGLNFVQSRTGMNDIYVVTAIIGSLVFLFNKKIFWSAVFVSLALTSKWTGFYAIGLIYLIKTIQEYNSKKLFPLAVHFALVFISLVLLLFPLITASQTKNFPITIFGYQFVSLDALSSLNGPIQLSGIFLLSIAMIFLPKFRSWGVYLLFPALIYIASYIPFFLQSHDYKTFISLQQQMWWYHTGLKAHHDYASPWWSWPLNLYPVWYFVDYHKDTISNIFASGNPGVFWVGTIALIITIKDLVSEYLRKEVSKIRPVFFTLLGFFVFWLPWALSPRIMFLYHFSPSVPFLSIALGYQINSIWNTKSQKIWAIAILGYLLISFILIYPMLTGVPLPRNIMLLFFSTNLTKNPFGS